MLKRCFPQIYSKQIEQRINKNYFEWHNEWIVLLSRHQDNRTDGDESCDLIPRWSLSGCPVHQALEAQYYKPPRHLFSQSSTMSEQTKPHVVWNAIKTSNTQFWIYIEIILGYTFMFDSSSLFRVSIDRGKSSSWSCLSFWATKRISDRKSGARKKSFVWLHCSH